MLSSSLPKSLAHLVIREDPETGEVIAPTAVRRASTDKFGTSPSGGSSQLSRTSCSYDSSLPTRHRPSLPPLRSRQDGASRLHGSNLSPARPQTTLSPPSRVHDYAVQREEYAMQSGPAHSYAYVPRSAPFPRRAPIDEVKHHVQPQLPRRHSHQPYARPMTAHQHPYPRPATSTFESYHPSSEIGNPSGRGPISRTTKACDTCRTRKIRCEDGPLLSSGEPGPCLRCLAAGIECVFSGVQKKRGPCPGSMRPSTSAARRGSTTSDHADSTPSPLQQPLPPRQLPVPTSARSSVGSINTPYLLTPPEDRRNSYGFSTSPSSLPRHPVSAPLVPGPSARWPESPETPSTAPRLPTPKIGRSLFDADYNLGMRLPAIDLGQPAKRAQDDMFGPTSNTLAPIPKDSRESTIWQRAA